MQDRCNSWTSPLLVLLICLAVTTLIGVVEPVSAATDGQEITWLERIELNAPFAKYPRLVKITQGKHAGELLLTYQDRDHGGNFWGVRSKDGGLTWSKPEVLLQWDRSDNTMIANCNIIELQDGRLMMVQQERDMSTGDASTSGIKVRYSSDGGETWTAKKVNGTDVASRDTGDLALRAGGWEPRAIQVPNDKNGDGNNDIYIFWTNHFNPISAGNTFNPRFGRGVTYVVSYDNGKTWYNPSQERYTGGILHRNFDQTDPQQDSGSGGGMPTPFILPNNRLAFVAECPECKQAPWLVASDPNDWDFTSLLKQPWSSIEYKESGDHKVYPDSPNNLWLATPVYGNAPFAAVLPNQKIAISQNSNHVIRVFVADQDGRNAVEQERPFGNDPSFYSFIEPIDDEYVIVGAYDPAANNKVLLRRGRMKGRGYVSVTDPQPGEVIKGRTPLVLDAPQQVQHITIKLDNDVLYDGKDVPRNIMLEPAKLTTGRHNIQLITLDDAGMSHNTVSSFENTPVDVKLDQGPNWIGQVQAQMKYVSITAPDLQTISVSLVQVAEEALYVKEIYSGSKLPDKLTIDTFDFAAGAYDLRVIITTAAGVTSTLDNRVVIDNWTVLEDPLRPPTVSGWFGSVDNLLTVARSEGWDFVGDDAVMYGGDGDRLRVNKTGEGYLTWQLAGLQTFRFTVYAQDADQVASSVAIMVSSDGQNWLPVTCAMTGELISGRNIKYILEASMPAGLTAEFVRLTLKPGADYTDVQLGHVYLVGKSI